MQTNQNIPVSSIAIETDNSGYTFPVFTDFNGTRWIPRQTPTGHCWMLDWVKDDLASLTPTSEVK